MINYQKQSIKANKIVEAFRTRGALLVWACFINRAFLSTSLATNLLTKPLPTCSDAFWTYFSHCLHILVLIELSPFMLLLSSR